MRSVQSPVVSGGYKLAYNHNTDLDVFSQQPVQDDGYMEDSFCVDDNDIDNG